MKRQGLLLLASRQQEIEDFLHKLNFKADTRFPGKAWYLPDSNKRISACITGVGKDSLDNTLGSFPDSFFQRSLLITGTAGSIDSRIEKNSIFLPETISGTINSNVYRMNNILLKNISDLLSNKNNQKKGRLHTADFPVIKKTNRQKIKNKFSAQAVDMETHYIISRLAERGITGPRAGMRVISDTPVQEDFRKIKKCQKAACRQLSELLTVIFSSDKWLELILSPESTLDNHNF